MFSVSLMSVCAWFLFVFFYGLAKKICCLALSFESVMFRPHFTSGNGLFGEGKKNNNTGTYLDQRGCSLTATRLGRIING